jgi:hypothetical protein
MDRRKMISIILREGLNLPKSTINNIWTGVDRDLVISLMEYGVIARQPTQRDYSDEWFVIYKISEKEFDAGWIREKELDDIVLGKEWADKNDIDNFLKFTGFENPNEWITKSSFINKFYDLTSYFGYENIIGSSYNRMDIKDVIEKINEFLPAS